MSGIEISVPHWSLPKSNLEALELAHAIDQNQWPMPLINRKYSFQDGSFCHGLVTFCKPVRMPFNEL